MMGALRKMTAAMVLLLWMLTDASAQFWHKKVPQYPYADFSSNGIFFSPSGDRPENFGKLYSRMDTVLLYGSGKLKIVHIGGSHVQGGSWTHQFRRNLLSIRYGLDGGRGFVFPYSVAGTNNPSSYTSAYAGTWEYYKCLQNPGDVCLGASGMAAVTSDTLARVDVILEERNPREWSPAFTFNTVTVFGYGELEPVILMDRDTVRGEPVPERGLYRFRLPRFSEDVSVGFTGTGGSFTLTGLYLDNPFNGITVDEIGVNGASTSSYLNCENFSRDIEELAPDLVILSIGINDIQGGEFDKERFKENYGRLVKSILEANPDCAILFTSVNDSHRRGRVNRHGESVQEAVKELATQFGGGVWDMFGIMGGYGSMQRWEYHGLARADKVHFTPEGYDLLGDLLFNALMDSYRTHSEAL